ncbi:hypothetical protein OAO01_02010 [Oligoflexia bacterium]|nr:hypothetical protein [Oligoflexia bacterium]
MPNYTDPFGDEFEVTQDDLEFLHKISPTLQGKKYIIPPPLFAPRERERRRYAFRNLRNLHKRKCDYSGKDIISHLHPDAPATVYHSDVWWSDVWNELDYGVDFDFDRTFFDQFKELYRRVPVLHHYVILSENSEYINGAASCKNCYLCFNLDRCENCYYIGDAVHDIFCLDCLGINHCELCYECINCENCYNLIWAECCVGCSNSYFLTECRQCRNCIGCTNLVNKEYYIFNEKASPEEFNRLRASFKSRAAVQEFQSKYNAHVASFPKKYYFGHSNESFSGNNVHHIKNSYHCFDAFELENCRYCSYIYNASNCMDYTIFGDGSQWIYNCIATGINCTNNAFCVGAWSGASDNYYCQLISACKNCFGCCGMRSKTYCVFNKQYSKDEYEQLVAKIIKHMQSTGEWGEFFPPSLSPYAFNKTEACLYHPLTKTEALRRGYNWKEEAETSRTPETYPIPDRIDQVQNSITSETLQCRATAKSFRIIPQELDFCRSQQIPVPDLCPSERDLSRIERRPPHALWKRSCAKTGQKILTAYGPDCEKVILSEKAYLEEVY